VGSLGALSAACSARTVPEHAPPASAASTEAPEGFVPTLTSALRSDPPLPGEPLENWSGLQASTAVRPRVGGAGVAALVYSCPMHPDVTSDKPGKCPRCGMVLVTPR